MTTFDRAYWDNRYNKEDTRWDLGKVSPPIKAYMDQVEDKSLRILIPGGGNSYEAEYLFNNGFKNVYVVDLSKTALHNIKSRVPHFPQEQLMASDFFQLDMTFDLIIEQTFFCALTPSLRTAYVKKMFDLLLKNGKLVGVLFDSPLNDNHPPFGGSKAEYMHYFQKIFQIKIMNDCYNSVESRCGKELFFIIEK